MSNNSLTAIGTPCRCPRHRPRLSSASAAAAARRARSASIATNAERSPSTAAIRARTPSSTAGGSAPPKGSPANGRRSPVVPSRSSLRQVLDAAEDVVPDYAGDPFLIPFLERAHELGVLLDRFLVRPAGLRTVREGPPQQPHEEKKHRRAGALVDPEVELPVEFRQPFVIRPAGGDLPVEGLDLSQVAVGHLG